MTRSHFDELKDRMTARDEAVLRDAEKFRLVTTRHIQRLHFDPTHLTPLAAARACNRMLARLRDAGVLRALRRRIGGARAGSAGFVWYLGPAGERLLRAWDPLAPSGRRNFREPSRHFVEHTLTVTELGVQTIEASRRSDLDIVHLLAEPASWQQSLTVHGTVAWLKPDLLLITTSADYEEHRFVEADLATEHLPVIMRQCAAYQSYRATGRYQAAHGLFPAVLWVTPSPARARAIKAGIAAAAGLDADLFSVCTAAEYTQVITGRVGGT